MPNTLSPAWVKNVYSLRKARSTTGGSLYTDVLQKSTSPQPAVYNPSLLPLLIPAFYTQLSTHFFAHLPPLIGHLYTQSTVPTIKRTKEI
jgi:hypothetical protein